MSLDEELARAALCGFFGSDGFTDMQAGQRRLAVKRVRELLIRHGVWEMAPEEVPAKKEPPKEEDGAEQAILQARRRKLQRIRDRGENPFAQVTEASWEFDDLWKVAVIAMAEAIRWAHLTALYEEQARIRRTMP